MRMSRAAARSSVVPSRAPGQGGGKMRRGALLALLALVATITLATVALAASAFDVQANQPQVAGDPSSNSTARFPTNKQNEPSIAVNPTNSSFLVAGANDEQLQPACGPGPVRGAGAA